MVVRMLVIFSLYLLLWAETSDASSIITKYDPVDGDTFRVDPKEIVLEDLKLSVRVLGVDTPEKGHRAKCEREAKLGEKASDFTKSLFRNAKENDIPVKLYNLKWDKYGGRLLADVKIGDLDLADELISKGLAREYHGEKKLSWCD